MGVIVGEQGDDRELVVLTAEDDDVCREVLRRGGPMAWQAGYVKTEEPPCPSSELGPDEWQRREDEDRARTESRAAPPRRGG